MTITINKGILPIIVVTLFAMNLWADYDDIPANAPPEGTPVETWAWLYTDVYGHVTRGVGIDVAFANDSIYFKVQGEAGEGGFNASDDWMIDTWVRGKINNDKVIIDSDLGLSTYYTWYNEETGQNEKIRFKGYGYFNPCDIYVKDMGWDDTPRPAYDIRTLEGDVVFEFDPVGKWSYNPSSLIWISESKRDSWFVDGREPIINTPLLYSDFELVCFQDGPLTPQAPEFLLATCSDGMKYFLLNGSIISEEGAAMNYANLYFRIYVDGSVLTNILWKYPGMKSSHRSHNGYTHFPFYKPNEEAYAELVYKYEDGSEVVSAKAPLVDVSGVDEVFRDDVDDIDAPVYDLSGRRVNPNRLAPGIYIRNGKKFMVR